LADDGIADKRVRYARDWTKGNTFHNFLRLAWPLIINDSLWVIGSVVDMIWVGRLGSASIAGVGVAGIVVMILMSARMGINTGARALISRFIGAGDTAAAVHVAQQAFVVAALYAATMAAIGIIFAEQILAFLGLQPDVIVQQSISGADDTIPPLVVSLVTLWAVQLPLAYLLSTYTELDAIGVRWAMVGATVVGSLAYAVYFKLGRWKRKRV